MAEIYKLFAVSLLKSPYSFSSNQIKSELEFEEQQNKATVTKCSVFSFYLLWDQMKRWWCCCAFHTGVD